MTSGTWGEWGSIWFLCRCSFWEKEIANNSLRFLLTSFAQLFGKSTFQFFSWLSLSLSTRVGIYFFFFLFSLLCLLQEFSSSLSHPLSLVPVPFILLTFLDLKVPHCSRGTCQHMLGKSPPLCSGTHPARPRHPGQSVARHERTCHSAWHVVKNECSSVLPYLGGAVWISLCL